MKRKAFEKEDELFKAALEEFSTNSYEEASLNKIVKNAGISKGTFYYHFQDKQALYIYILEQSVKAKWDFINERIKDFDDLDNNRDIFEIFKLQARIGMEFAKKYPKFHMLGKMFSKERGKEIYQIAKGTLGKGSDDLLETMVSRAIEKGDLRKDLPKKFILKIISHLLMNFDEIFNEDEDFELEKIIENLDNYVSFMKYGLGSCT
ncbi:MAG: TetR/AcrR family transcriptional regulator [Tissierellia bacterium]|nr:TetR/AcrR family transcriptional regulator [Tissierellia bacterium]